MPEPFVALAMPCRDGKVCADALTAFHRASRSARRLELRQGHSLLTFTFNLLWAEILNARAEHPLTHAAMIHDDVCPEPGWLDVLLAELEATGADLVSALVPIKSGLGLTSTAVENPRDPWVVRRLTLHEAFALPGTFTSEDAGGPLLCNTGLWVCRLGPWAERVCFRQHDRVVREDGRWVARTSPEDWDFSRQLHALGLKVAVTRKVPLYHERPEFHTRGVWGAWRTDEAFREHERRQDAA